MDEKKGKLFPRETIMTNEGGTIQIKGQMSRKEYIEKHNKGMTIGRLMNEADKKAAQKQNNQNDYDGIMLN